MHSFYRHDLHNDKNCARIMRSEAFLLMITKEKVILQMVNGLKKYEIIWWVTIFGSDPANIRRVF
jgi:hypothetical protein